MNTLRPVLAALKSLFLIILVNSNLLTNILDKTCNSWNQGALNWDEGEWLQCSSDLTCLVWEDGYFTADSGTTCKRTCPSNTYPNITVDETTSEIISKQCLEWPEECPNWVGEDPTLHWVSCPEGQYLQITSPSTFSGQWVEPSETNTVNLTIFVSNNSTYISTSPTPDGSLTSPFFDLEDALNYVYERSVPNFNTQASIYLFSGDHYLLYSPTYHYLFQKQARSNFSEYAVNHEISIMPLFCNFTDTGGVNISQFCTDVGGTVTVYNKRKDRFMIHAGKSMAISNIVFDSLDSLLDPSDSTSLACLNSRVKWCEIATDGTVTNSTISDAALCRNNLVSDEQCTLTSYK